MTIVIVNEVPNSPNVVGEFLGKRERFANEPTAALTDGAIEPFNQTGFATAFVDGFMAFGRQNTGVDLKEISEADGSLAVSWRQ